MWSSGSPSPFRNLLTPLGTGSGYESRYSATRTSNRPGTQNMIKKDESHCSSIHVNPVFFFFRASTRCDSLNFGHMSALIWFHYTPAFSHSMDCVQKHLTSISSFIKLCFECNLGKYHRVDSCKSLDFFFKGCWMKISTDHHFLKMFLSI